MKIAAIIENKITAGGDFAKMSVDLLLNLKKQLKIQIMK